jgi:Mn2+/Fe2+ NRAMP family transporter
VSRRRSPHGGWAYVRTSGSGLIAGAADIDPTTVATLVVIGATTVFGLSWLIVLTLPLLAVIQMISARVGMMSRRDLQGCVAQRFGRWPRTALLGSVVVVTVITIAADLEGGAAALGLLFHTDFHWWILPLAAAVVGLLLAGSYGAVVAVVKFVLLGLLAYVASALLAHVRWSDVAHATLVPNFHFTSEWTLGALALLGTTLTSYVYVWQTIEDSHSDRPISALGVNQVGAVSGMVFAVIVFWFILVSTGATLGVHHQRVDTAGQAAQALRPLAGSLASDIFALGLLASALVALPILVATAAYVVGSDYNWERGLSKPIRHAPRFYSALAVSVVLGAAIAFSGVSPIRILFVAGVVSGIASPLGLVFLLLVAADRDIMRQHPIPGWLKTAGWAVTALMVAATLTYLAEQLAGP